MATLLVSTSTDFTSVTLNDITRIRFTNPDITATFDDRDFYWGTAVGDQHISPDVLWVGSDLGPVFVEIISGALSTVIDGREWRFSSWANPENSITIRGSDNPDGLYGSRKADVIHGRGGEDFIYASRGGDVLHGGSGDDRFWYIEPDVTITDTIAGDRGAADRIILFNTGVYDFEPSDIAGVEVLEFHVPATANFGGDAIGGPGGIRTIDGSGGADTLIVRSAGNGVSLAGLSFVDWDRSATIRIEGTSISETMTGSALKDTFVADGVDDQLFGRGGNDTFEVSRSVPNGVVDGGRGIDRIVGVGSGTLQLTATAIAGVEILELGERSIAVLSADHVGTGGLRQGIITIIGNDQDNVVEVQGNYIDVFDITLQNWDEQVDRFALRGTDGNDVIVGSAYADRLYSSDGGDDCSLGDGDDVFVIQDHIGAGTIFEGGGDTDTLFVIGYASVDISVALISGVERILLNPSFDGGDVLTLSGEQIGGTSGLNEIDMAGSAGRLRIIGSSADLSNVAVINPGLAGLFATFEGTALADTIVGSSRDDQFNGTDGADVIAGGAGSDLVSYNDSSAAVVISLSGGTARGGEAEGDVLTGIEHLIGSIFADRLTGNGDSNIFNGGAGDDQLNGGNGADQLWGHYGRDTFRFGSTMHSSPGAGADTIADFRFMGELDLIDLESIDAQTSSAATDEAFVFIGSDTFTAEGQIRAVADGANTILRINTTGTNGAEMEIVLLNTAPGNLSAADFLL